MIDNRTVSAIDLALQKHPTPVGDLFAAIRHGEEFPRLFAPSLTQKAIFEYTTEHLRSLRDNDESGADYFVDAQDICEEWKDSINVETVSENDQVAQVKLTLGYGKGVSLYAVNLVKEKGKWLMDSVKPISHSSIYCPRQAEGGE